MLYVLASETTPYKFDGGEKLQTSAVLPIFETCPQASQKNPTPAAISMQYAVLLKI